MSEKIAKLVGMRQSKLSALNLDRHTRPPPDIDRRRLALAPENPIRFNQQESRIWRLSTHAIWRPPE